MSRISYIAKLAIASAFLAPVASFVPVVPVVPVAQVQRVELADEVMGTTFSVVLYGQDRSHLERTAGAAIAEAQRLDALLSNYKTDSELSRVNRLAADRPVSVSAELFALLASCADYSRSSDGAFDVTVGPLMKVWGFYRGEGELAPATEVARVLPLVGMQHVQLDRAARTVRFDRGGVEIDLGGIGKGYAVDRIADIVRNQSVDSAFISAGGSSIYAIGRSPDEVRGWRVAIRDPYDPRRTAAEVTLENESLSTSGTTEKFFRANGRVYSHLMDPRTGYPAHGVLSVSVVAPRTIDSEAWTKPYFVNGASWAAAHLQPSFRVFMCGESSDNACAWLQR
jgi:thiamine biosynthesis lipoprotein